MEEAIDTVMIQVRISLRSRSNKLYHGSSVAKRTDIVAFVLSDFEYCVQESSLMGRECND